MKKRYLFVELECDYCKEYLNIMDLINSRLSPLNRVRVIDITNSRVMEILEDFLIGKLNIESVPTLYLDGYSIIGISSKEWIRGFLESYFKEEFIV